MLGEVLEVLRLGGTLGRAEFRLPSKAGSGKNVIMNGQLEFSPTGDPLSESVGHTAEMAH